MIPFSELKIDSLLVSALPNIRYLTGFTGSNALLLVTPDSQTLFTDPRYTIQASQECSCKVKTVKKGELERAAAKVIQRKRLKRVGFEASRMVYEAYRHLKEEVPLGVSLWNTTGVVERLRMVKTAEEVERIRRSVHTNSQAYEMTLRNIRPGMTEFEVASRLEFEMRQLGAEKTAFETIVAAGAHAALPHAQPSAQKIAVDQLLLIDMGACQDGYMSDMTRTVSIGKTNPNSRKMYDAVLQAQLAALEAVRPGVTAGKVDRAARKVLDAEGLGKAFTHSTGHGLGLEIHEPPRLGRGEKTRLEAGMVITIEPGTYVRDVGGVRIEDTVLVTKTGCEVLTPTTKELILL